MGLRLGWNSRGSPLYLTAFFVCVFVCCFFLCSSTVAKVNDAAWGSTRSGDAAHLGSCAGSCPSLLLQPGVRRWPRCRLERQRPLPTGVPAHGAPGAEHQDLELFFCSTFFFQILVGRNFIEIPRVGLRGWSGRCGGNELGFVADKKENFLSFSLTTGLGWL